MFVAEGVAVVLGTPVNARDDPLHIYTLVPPPPCADRFTVPPAQIGPSLAGAAVGAGVTVTVVVAIHPVDIA